MRVRPSGSARSQKAQYIVAVLVPALIVVLSITGFVWAQKAVAVVVDGKTLHMKTQAATVADLLSESGIPVGSGDVVVPSLDTSVEDGSSVLVRHAVPVSLDISGQPVEIEVVGKTVADALVAAGVDPAESSAVHPALSTPLRAGMKITVPDVFVRIFHQQSRVEPATRVRKDPSLPKGVRRTIVEGSAGRLLQVYRVLVMNGREGRPMLSAQKQIRAPKPRILVVGTGPKNATRAQLAKRAKRPNGGREMRVEATGYSPEEPGLDHTTATGARAKHGVIAVDPRVIRLGTRVYVPGYGYAVAADTGGAIKGRKIDLCFDTVGEAIRWGRRHVTIIILD